jgi:hypothetical protein
MHQLYIIEVSDGGRRAFVTERRGELFLTRFRHESAVYQTELDAKCAKVYIGDRYHPRIVPLAEVTPSCREE